MKKKMAELTAPDSRQIPLVRSGAFSHEYMYLVIKAVFARRVKGFSH